MQLSMWTYPWDLQDQGTDTVLTELCDYAGVNTISLATSYHAGRFLQPRSPIQKSYFPEDGTIYYVPNKRLWEGKSIQPLIAQNLSERGDMLAQLIDERKKGGPKVSCWTVCLHNTRLGMKHPYDVTRNAFGNANYYNLCPSSPAARDYVITLAKDISTQYEPDIIELESPNFMGFAHEYHHEKDGVGLTDEDDFMLSLCFCNHCMANATKAGINANGARDTVRALITDICEREIPQKQFPEFPAAGIDAFKDYADLHTYLTWRNEPITSLIGEIRDATNPATEVILIDLEDGWLGGVNLEAIGQVCDGAILCCYSGS
jgi:hypothetical protein